MWFGSRQFNGRLTRKPKIFRRDLYAQRTLANIDGHLFQIGHFAPIFAGLSGCCKTVVRQPRNLCKKLQLEATKQA